MDLDKIIYNIAVWAIPVLFAITVHEVAHGWVANKLGDGTARMLGRLTLNPFKHIDPIGTVLVPLVLLISPVPFVFGWAKPVPVDTRNFKNPRRDMAIVAIAGPLSNIIMAIIWVIILNIGQSIITDPSIAKGFQAMAYAGVLINLVLFAFNLMPIPPLDGGRVLSGLVPPKISNLLDRIEPYGFFIVIGLVYMGAFQPIILPVFDTFARIFGL
ncbi:MAG TPA: site-2 protease family protein [Leucothrix mucor]|nr:site-2 protease family protein [Leucothrix mucor]